MAHEETQNVEMVLAKAIQLLESRAPAGFVVASICYTPHANHPPDRWAVKFVGENRDEMFISNIFLDGVVEKLEAPYTPDEPGPSP